MTAEYASFDDLTSTDVDSLTAEVELSSGKKVLVRALSRYELMLVTKGEPDNATYERKLLATCLVQPKLTEKQAEAIQRRTLPGDKDSDINRMSDKIRELSGLSEGADKSDDAEVSD